MNDTILIKGAGEHATGTAHRLFSAGFKVLMTEIENPICVRKMVSFANAVFEKEFIVEGVKAKLIEDLNDFDGSFVGVIIDEEGKIIKKMKPSIIIDARIAKKNIDNSIEDAELVIGLGPELKAGRDVHYVIETNRGHDLGRIIEKGFAEADTGVPGNIKGESGKRVLRAPADGKIITFKNIGDRVEIDELIAKVGDHGIKSQLNGMIRGLINDGTKVRKNLKIGDVDPRPEKLNCYTLSDKTRTISRSVLELVCRFKN